MRRFTASMTTPPHCSQQAASRYLLCVGADQGPPTSQGSGEIDPGAGRPHRRPQSTASATTRQSMKIVDDSTILFRPRWDGLRPATPGAAPHRIHRQHAGHPLLGTNSTCSGDIATSSTILPGWGAAQHFQPFILHQGELSMATTAAGVQHVPIGLSAAVLVAACSATPARPSGARKHRAILRRPSRAIPPVSRSACIPGFRG